jgi:hypothetical protein
MPMAMWKYRLTESVSSHYLQVTILFIYPRPEVELVVESIRENNLGQKIIGYKFKPISLRTFPPSL